MLIAHLSDPHMRPPGELYQGLVDSNAMFEAAVRHLNALDPAPDLVIVTGDIVDHGEPAEYERARSALAAIRQPVLLLPGNHDEREAFRAAFFDHAYLPETGPLHFVVGDKGPVRIVGLDVTVPGDHHGEAGVEACAWLAARLSEEPDRPTLLMLHQPPFEGGIACIDAYNCRDGVRLAAVLLAHPQVERVLCGHVHRFMLARFAGTVLVTAPSTTTAIALRLAPDAEPASYVEPPAFLLHLWREGAGLVTHYVPIGRFPGPMPFF
ncbi:MULTISPECIES: phosphodiesterase [unclassified Aureimonas]|uniref:phosphodiesterase n=1 Tax=unclassified Aureimonas TaxID=2615206 RepID=UPI0006F8B8EE|nr:MULTISPECIES: phosphodiesterase [unclassified Aureimonas]KQT63961.1 metallophosphatase [Aureimonas sp. Leaf427]KQT81154.1 metallophosphatase [Aureimonas sp. Leaf460]